MGRFDEDLYVNGNFAAKSMSVPLGAVADAQVAAGAEIATSKLRHKHKKSISQAGTAATETRAIHVCAGLTGTAVSFAAGLIAANSGAATVSVDLKKNGTSILTAPISLTTTPAARTLLAGTISSGALVVGDWLEVVITATAGGGTLGTGLFVQLEIDEGAV
jgi:hypothetical protein